MVCAASVGVVVCSVVVVVACGVEAAWVDVAVCSALVVCVSPAARVEVEESASGGWAGDLRALAGLASCAACACVAWWRDREAFLLVPAPFAALVVRVLPG